MEENELILDESNVPAYFLDKGDSIRFSDYISGDQVSPDEFQFSLTRDNIILAKLYKNETPEPERIIIPIKSIKKANVKIELFHYWCSFEYTDSEGKESVLKLMIKFDKKTNYDMGEERYYKYIDAFKEAGINIKEPNLNHKKVKNNWFLASKVIGIMAILFVVGYVLFISAVMYLANSVSVVVFFLFPLPIMILTLRQFYSAIVR